MIWLVYIFFATGKSTSVAWKAIQATHLGNKKYSLYLWDKKERKKILIVGFVRAKMIKEQKRMLLAVCVL